MLSMLKPTAFFSLGCCVASLLLGGTAQAQSILNEEVTFEPRQDTYTFTAEAGDTVIIRMSSEEFDTFLSLIDPAGQVLEQNDDYDGNPNATIVNSLPTDGEYTVLAGSFYGQLGGTYQLTIETATDYQQVYDRALELMQSEDYGQAAEAYNAASALRPDEAKVYLGQADALLRQAALNLGEDFAGPNSLPSAVRERVIQNYETAARLFNQQGDPAFATLILRQAEFIRSGELADPQP